MIMTSDDILWLEISQNVDVFDLVFDNASSMYHDDIGKLFLFYYSSHLYLFLSISLIYSSSHKSSIFCFAQLLLQILVNYQNQGQIWNLLVLTFSKHPLHVQFDQVLAEIFEVEDTLLEFFLSMVMDFLEMKITEIWTICSKNCSVHHQRYQYQQE